MNPRPPDPPGSASRPWVIIGASAAVFVIALGLRAGFARGLAGPLDNDATDYLLVARNLAQGRGFVEDVVGYYHPPPAAVTHPSHDHWMPLITILIAASISLLGNSFFAAQLPNLILGAAVPVVGMAVARELGARPRYALLTGILMAAGPRLVYYSLDTEAVMPYAFFGGLAFVGAVRGAAGKPAWLAGSGMAAGLCYLSRNDGSLWVPAFVGVYLLSLRDRSRPQARLRHWLGAAAGYLLVTAPWLARNYAAFGSLFPPGMSNVMFYQNYTDVYNFEKVASLHTYLAQGAAAIVKSKAVALVGVLRGIGQDGVIHWALFPPAILGIALAAPLARRVILVHLAVVALVWALLMDVLAGPFGGTIRTMMLLAMYLVPTAMLGLDRLEQWMQRRLPLPQLVFPALVLLFSLHLASFSWKGKAKLNQFSREEWNYFHKLGQLLKQASPPQPTVMSFRPWQLNAAENLPAVSIPSDGLSAILAASRKYRVEFLVLENYWIRDELGYRAEAAYLTRLDQEFQATGETRDPDFIPYGRVGDALIFRLAPAQTQSEPKPSP